MTPDRDNLSASFHGRRIEPLPVDFESELIEVDHLLSRAIESSSTAAPLGMSSRVFEMSVASLPRDAREPSLKLVAADAPALVFTRRSAFIGWRRMALAASVLIAAGATLWITWPRGESITIAQNDPPVAPIDAGQPLVRTASIDFSDLNRMAASNPSDLDAFEADLYLLDASEVRSFNDLNNDLRQLVAQLEM